MIYEFHVKSMPDNYPYRATATIYVYEVDRDNGADSVLGFIRREGEGWEAAAGASHVPACFTLDPRIVEHLNAGEIESVRSGEPSIHERDIA